MTARLYAVAVFILAVGGSTGLLVYALAEDQALDPALQEMLLSKRHARALQHFGGKAAVLSDEFMRWFDSLWQGKTLGITIACLSVAAALCVALYARYLTAEQGRENPK